MNDHQTLIAHTADISAAFLSHNPLPVAEVGSLIGGIFATLSGLGVEPEPEARPQPAVSIRRSVRPDSILSMIDGQPYKMLKRHIGQHGYTPESYRETFGLPANYPMVAPNYAQVRRELAVKIGLGRNPHQRRGRRSKAA